jgi:hypothetical protein
MPLNCAKQNNAPVCHGHNWAVVDEPVLVKLLARLVCGYYLHVATILSDPSVKLPAGPALSHEELKKRLGPPGTDANRHHRDGWIFQMISWIAAHLTSSAAILIASPQSRPADKGFDGLIVELRDGGKSVDGVVICEDKATENGRTTVTDKVWPELLKFEKGARDAELQNEVTALLSGREGNVLQMVENIHWKQVRRYRVSVTVDQKEHALGGRARIFKDFDLKVLGDVKRRQGEYVLVNDVRQWMDGLCKGVLAELETMSKVKHV